MYDNTEHADAIQDLHLNIAGHYRGQQVFVANNLLWYPVRGRPKVRLSPDVMAAFGRSPGYRGSYKTW